MYIVAIMMIMRRLLEREVKLTKELGLTKAFNNDMEKTQVFLISGVIPLKIYILSDIDNLNGFIIDQEK